MEARHRSNVRHGRRRFEISFDHKGAAMVVVLCIMALLLVISLSLLLTTSSLVGAAKKDQTATQCKILAESYDSLLRKQLKAEYQVVGFPARLKKNGANADEPPGYLAMRSVRAAFSDKDNVGISVDNTEGCLDFYNTSGEADINVDEEKTSGYLYDKSGEVIDIENGYRMKLQMYLTGNENDIKESLKDCGTKYSASEYTENGNPIYGYDGKHLDYHFAEAYNGQVTLHTTVICFKGSTSYTITNTYNAIVEKKSGEADELEKVIYNKTDEKGNPTTEIEYKEWADDSLGIVPDNYGIDVRWRWIEAGVE